VEAAARAVLLLLLLLLLLLTADEADLAADIRAKGTQRLLLPCS
jgi:hypothetical protein